jgi:hypothetical protein
MTLKKYELRDKAEDGRLYAVVELENGSTFGQLVQPGTIAEIDRAVLEAVARVEAQATPKVVPELGTVRLSKDIARVVEPA